MDKNYLQDSKETEDELEFVKVGASRFREDSSSLLFELSFEKLFEEDSNDSFPEAKKME